MPISDRTPGHGASAPDPRRMERRGPLAAVVVMAVLGVAAGGIGTVRAVADPGRIGHPGAPVSSSTAGPSTSSSTSPGLPDPGQEPSAGGDSGSATTQGPTASPSGVRSRTAGGPVPRTGAEGPGTIHYRIYTTKAGDTVASVAHRFNVGQADLRADNHIGTDVASFRAGTVLYIR